MSSRLLQYASLFLGSSLVLMACSAQERSWTGSFEKAKTSTSSDGGGAAAAGNKESIDAGAISAVPQLEANAGKASDDDEGIPGYFQDITAIELEDSFQSADLSIRVPMAAIVALQATGVYLNAWIVDSSMVDFRSRTLLLSDADFDPVQTGSAIINAVGDYEMTVPKPRSRRDEVLLLTLDRSSQPASLSMMTNVLGSFGGLAIKEGVFGKLNLTGMISSDVDEMVRLLGEEMANAILSQDFDTMHSSVRAD